MREIKAKFESTCKCGVKIKKGDDCTYYPQQKKCVCKNCGDKHKKEIYLHDLDEKMGGF